MQQLSIIVAAVAVANAPAKADDFLACDGSEAPTIEWGQLAPNRSLGTSEPRRGGLLGLLYGKGGTETPAEKFEVRFGAAGADSCARALAAPVLAKWPSRRAQLLIANALHLYASDRVSESLSSLDAAAAAARQGNDNPFLQESFRASIDLSKAYFLGHIGREPEALRLLDGLAVARPYSASLGNALIQIRLSAPSLEANEQTLRSKLAPVDPEQFQILSYQAALRGDFAAVVGLDSLIDPTQAPPRPGWVMPGNDFREGVKHVTFGGMAAYALAALGRKESAEARLTQLDLRLTAFANGRPSRQAVLDYARGEVVKWRKAIALREKAPNLAPGELNTQLDGAIPRVFPYVADVLERSSVKDPAGENVAALKKTMLQVGSERPSVTMEDLYRMLPARLYPGDPVAIRNARNIWLGERDDGYTMQREPSGAVIVRFSHSLLPREAVEEMAMLSAARAAHKEGKSGFIVLSQDTVERRVTNCLNTLKCNAYQSGHDSQMRIRFVDKALNASSNPQVLDADAVEASISTRYARGIKQ